MENEFLCVAFPNRVAQAMGGVTIHNGGDVNVGDNDKKLVTLSIDELYSRNQNLRWILIDEIGMVPDSLLGAFEKNLSDAAEQNNRYFKRKDKSKRPFGGYNLLMFGDLFQIPPNPCILGTVHPADG